MSERTGISLLIRNISRRIRSDELRKTFEEFGDVRDVYIPRDFHTREIKGFAFVEFKNERDAEEALRNLDGSRLDGREITVVFAQEKRKSTDEMRTRERFERNLEENHTGLDLEVAHLRAVPVVLVLAREVAHGIIVGNQDHDHL
ncbi:hypothetical protein ABG067_003368 [Albugo candida]